VLNIAIRRTIAKMPSMKQNLACRSAFLNGFILLANLLLSPLLGAGEPDAKGRETPQALVATYNDAVARKDWKKCYSCCDAKWRANMLSSLLTTIAESHDAKLKAIVTKHAGEKLPAADEIAIPVVRSDTRMFKDLRLFEQLQKQFRDLPAFIDEISTYVDGFPAMLDVKDFKITGALGVAHGRIGDPPLADMPQPIHFSKIDGHWYLTIPDPPPPLSVSERAAQLDAEAGTLWVTLGRSGPPSEKTYDEVRMSVQPFRYQSPSPTVHLVRLSEAEAKKLIEYLATEGFLQHALEIGKQEISDRERQTHSSRYILQVSTSNLQKNADLGLKLHEDLGWGPGLVKRLEGLRGVLNEEGARAIDAILSKLSNE
jgi:hypothetical protein